MTELGQQRAIAVCGVLERPVTKIDRAEPRYVRKTLTACTGM
ncbi:hypothetical protein [Streptomyces sp. IB201691-2A2]|nr:hypothetical protein [Streptomyces sp. IB201691-2A2]